MRADWVRFLATPVLIATLTVQLRGAEGDPAALELRVTEGDGAAYAVGSRATRGVTVLVSDESGRPVSGATVSFTLPSDGPGGTFATGARNEIVSTRADGRATVWGMQWNRLSGALEIRITAAKGQARAGILCTQYLNDGRMPDTRTATPASKGNNVAGLGNANIRDAQIQDAAPPPAPAARAPIRRVSSGGHRWLWLTLGAAGLAVAGAAVAGRASSGSSTAATAAAASASAVQISAPTFTISKP